MTFNMASACALEWVPDSLYNTAVSAIVSSYSRHRREIKSLPENVQFDIYYKVKRKSSFYRLFMNFRPLSQLIFPLQSPDSEREKFAIKFHVIRK